jgi:hypothetical protein
MKWARNVMRIGETRNTYKFLVGKPDGNSPLGKPRRRREDNRLNLREVVWKVVDWIHLAQDRDQLRASVNTVMNFRIP